MSSKSSARKNKPVSGAAARRAAGRGQSAGPGSTPTPGDRLPIVGLGASAGGLEALKGFFGAMPEKTGLSFVVVVHLDPTHDSLMPELLAKSTTLAVHHAQDRQPLEADHVYIIPPNRALTIDRGLVRVREVADRRRLRGSIDHFFRSLADDQHDGAIGVILSGTGTEGTSGLRAIKAEGGMVMAQAPDTASQSGMPRSAIATGLVDFVLSPEQMPKALLEYVQHARIHRAATPAARIFRRLGTAKHSPLTFPLPQPASVDALHAAAPTMPESTVAALANHALLEHLAPAAVVVRQHGQIAHFFGAMDRYINLPSGEATLDVLSLARDPLKPAFRAALHDAVRRNRETVLETLRRKRGRHRTTLRITVRPLDGPGATERLWLMIFEERPLPAGPVTRRVKGATQEFVRRLETELRTTKQEQHHLIVELETSNAELQAANEEVLSMNEELQSTNEELVTSKEELQSMNEELTTLNSQLQEKVQEVSAVNDDLANLLVSTDIATVLVDRELRIRRFTTAAIQVLNLLPSDIGRPIDHVAANVVGIDMSRDTRAVLKSLQPIEKEWTAEDGKHYIVRVLPYRFEGDIVQGVVITLSDVTALKKIETELRAARERVSADLRRMTHLHEVSARLAGQGDLTTLLNEIVAAAIEITSAVTGTIQVVDDIGGLTIAAQTGFDARFLDIFRRVDASADSAYGTALADRKRVIVDDVTQDSVFRNSPSLKVLMAAGVRGVQLTPLVSPSGKLVGIFSTYYRTSPHLDDTDLRWLDLMARQAADLLERRRLEDVRTQASDELERRVTDRTKWLTLMHDVGRAIDEARNWSEALHLVMRRICEAEDWQVGYVYLPASDAADQLTTAVGYSSGERFLPFHVASQQTRHSFGHSLPGRVFEDGHHVWVNDREALLKALPLRAAAAAQVGLKSAVALPVRVGTETLAVVELCSDRPHPERDELVGLMRDVSTQIGRVIERERIMAQVGEIIWGEQQDLIHTLHDALGQQLTGLGMLAASLHQRLKDRDTESAQTAQQIAGTAQEALERVRQLSRGLFPSDIDGTGFVAALQQLASTTESLHKIPCSLACDTAIAIPNSRIATQLYRIAQEAVTNALRHAEAEHITIQLNADGGTTTLRVVDDGVGIHHRVPAENGIGLRIMRHRAMSMGAGFTVGPAADKGTVVTCTLPEAPHAGS